jgi:short-subunit dehydrogenase
MALAFADDGIRVNAIAPGFIKTEMSRAGREEPGYNDKVVARIPSGEWSDPEELTGAAVFLASPASKLITGVTIPIAANALFHAARPRTFNQLDASEALTITFSAVTRPLVDYQQVYPPSTTRLLPVK